MALYCIVYLYSAQYLRTQSAIKPIWLQRYSLNSQVNHILLTERQRLKDKHLPMSLRFFSLPLGIGPNDRGPPFKVVIWATMYLPVPGIEPRSSEFLDKCATR